MKRKLGHIDLKTGEVFEEGTLAYFSKKRQNGFVEGWLAMANLVFKALKMLTHVEDLRVMMALLEQVTYENKIAVHQVSMAKDLGMHPPHVSRAIKRLVEAGLILKGPKEGINCSYVLNPELGWKGSAKNHVKAQREYRESQRRAAESEKAPEPKDATS